jgi:hypothetical protein
MTPSTMATAGEPARAAGCSYKMVTDGPHTLYAMRQPVAVSTSHLSRLCPHFFPAAGRRVEVASSAEASC